MLEAIQNMKRFRDRGVRVSAAALIGTAGDASDELEQQEWWTPSLPSRSTSPEIEGCAGTSSNGTEEMAPPLTWNALWDATMWTVRHRSQAAVSSFKERHGTDSCRVAANVLLYDRGGLNDAWEDSKCTSDNSITAFDYACANAGMMQRWYDAAVEDYDEHLWSRRQLRPLPGCRCVPRHTSIGHRRLCRTRRGSDISSSKAVRFSTASATAISHNDGEEDAKFNGEWINQHSRYLGAYGTTAMNESMFSWALRHRQQQQIQASASSASSALSVAGESAETSPSSATSDQPTATINNRHFSYSAQETPTIGVRALVERFNRVRT
jgi:hypothetical protein